MQYLIEFSFPALALLQNSGSANWARAMTTRSALSCIRISSAISGVLILPQHRQQTGLPADTCGRLHVEAWGMSTGATSYTVAAVRMLPREIFSTSTPASPAHLQKSMTSSMSGRLPAYHPAVYPHEQGHPLRHIGPNRLNTGQRKLFAVFKAATPSVCAPVDPARKERMRR